MLKRSLNSAKIKFFKLDYELVMKKLKEYAERVRGKGVKAVILIGSLARGDYTAFSDADIVITADRNNSRQCFEGPHGEIKGVHGSRVPNRLRA